MDLTQFEFTQSPISDFMQTTFIDIDDNLRLCVEVGGDPSHPPLLLILGLGSQMVFWTDNFVKGLIDAGFFVIRFDNRDIGLSTKIARPFPRFPINNIKMMARMQIGLTNRHYPVAYNLFDMVEDTKRLLDKMGLEQVYAVGASMGGMIAQILACKYPKKVAKLGLMFTSNNQPMLPPPKPRQLHTLIAHPKTTQVDDVVAFGIWVMQRIGSPNHVDEAEVERMVRLRFERSYHPRGSLQQLQAILATGSIVKYDKKITQPTIVLHGEKDGLIPPAHGRAVAKAIPNSEFHLIHGMGHDLAKPFVPVLVDYLVKHWH
ncbi:MULTISPECIES: alpha/beta fold hydrolase [unclassified Moraxella]|uniref:alpha/beta fold hydrolase n=1 Tax=unclassified Moraxella TaxID=2685852 RepID=UPI003AF6376C